MDKKVFEEMTDDELEDYVNLCQWLREQLGEGVCDIAVNGHTVRVLDAIVKLYQQGYWQVELSMGRDGANLNFTVRMPKTDNKPADCRSMPNDGIHPVST